MRVSRVGLERSGSGGFACWPFFDCVTNHYACTGVLCIGHGRGIQKTAGSFVRAD
jgi:hypothetical protein